MPTGKWCNTQPDWSLHCISELRKTTSLKTRLTTLKNQNSNTKVEFASLQSSYVIWYRSDLNHWKERLKCLKRNSVLLSKYDFFYMVAQKYERKHFLQILRSLLLRSLLSFKLCLVCHVCIQFLKHFEKNIICITLTGQTLLVRAENAFSIFHEVWMWKPFIPVQSHLGELSSAKFRCPCQDHELSWHIISMIAGDYDCSYMDPPETGFCLWLQMKKKDYWSSIMNMFILYSLKSMQLFPALMLLQ